MAAPFPPTPAQLDEIKYWYGKRKTITWIANKLGLHRTTVSKYLKVLRTEAAIACSPAAELTSNEVVALKELAALSPRLKQIAHFDEAGVAYIVKYLKRILQLGDVLPLARGEITQARDFFRIRGVNAAFLAAIQKLFSFYDCDKCGNEFAHLNILTNVVCTECGFDGGPE